MPIQAIDNLLIAPRTENAAKPAQQELVKGTHEQVYLNSQMVKNTRQRSEMANDVSETDERREKYDAKEKGKNSYEADERERKRKEKEEKELRAKAGVGGSFFDIKI